MRKKNIYIHMWQITHIRHPNNSFLFCFIHINHNYTESLLISQVFKDPIKHDTIILNLNPKQFNGLGKRFFYILQKCMIRGSYFWIPMNALSLFFSYRNWYYGSLCFTKKTSHSSTKKIWSSYITDLVMKSDWVYLKCRSTRDILYILCHHAKISHQFCTTFSICTENRQRNCIRTQPLK